MAVLQSGNSIAFAQLYSLPGTSLWLPSSKSMSGLCSDDASAHPGFADLIGERFAKRQSHTPEGFA